MSCFGLNLWATVRPRCRPLKVKEDLVNQCSKAVYISISDIDESPSKRN